MKLALADSLKTVSARSGVERPFSVPSNASAVPLETRFTAVSENQPNTIVLVPISKGYGQPLFMMPADGEDGARFRRLARHLGNDWSLNLVRPQTNRHERTVDAIEEAAAQSVAAICSLHPEGPYVIGGFCYGGVIAFETVRLLEAQGKEALLVLFDTPAPGYPNLSTDWLFWVEFFVSRARISWRTRTPMPILGYIRRIIRMAAWFAVRGIGPKKTRLWQTGPVHWLWNQAQSKYFSFYTPRPTAVPILHFMARDEEDLLINTSRHGWEKVANVTTEWLPGNHDRFFFDKINLAAMAASLASWVETSVGTPAPRR